MASFAQDLFASVIKRRGQIEDLRAARNPFGGRKPWYRRKVQDFIDNAVSLASLPWEEWDCAEKEDGEILRLILPMLNERAQQLQGKRKAQKQSGEEHGRREAS